MIYFALLFLLPAAPVSATSSHVVYQASAGTVPICQPNMSIALMFLAKNDLLHRDLWRQWLQSAANLVPKQTLKNALATDDVDTVYQACRSSMDLNAAKRQFLFTVYLHTRPDYDEVLGAEALPPQHRIPTAWGGTSLVNATRILLQRALENPRNHFFLLLSDSTIPLYPALVVYMSLITRNTSAVQACAETINPDYDTLPERYHQVFDEDTSQVPPSAWRKSSQFFGLLRPHAALVASENNTVWQAYATKCPLDTVCFADEHYVPTLLASLGLEHETDCHGELTYSQWEQGGVHPTVFISDILDVATLQKMRGGEPPYAPPECRRHIRRPTPIDRDAFVFLEDITKDLLTALREEGVGPNQPHSVPPRCPLFARKFPAEVQTDLMHLLRKRPLGVLPDPWLAVNAYNLMTI